MKKSILKSMLALVVVAAFASPAFSADQKNDTWNNPSGLDDDNLVIVDAAGPGLTAKDLKFSANVRYFYAADAAGEGETFGLATYNTKGTKVYASNAGSSKIYSTVAAITPDTYEDVKPVLAASGVWASATWAEVGK